MSYTVHQTVNAYLCCLACPSKAFRRWISVKLDVVLFMMRLEFLFHYVLIIIIIMCFVVTTSYVFVIESTTFT